MYAVRWRRLKFFIRTQKKHPEGSEHTTFRIRLRVLTIIPEALSSLTDVYIQTRGVAYSLMATGHGDRTDGRTFGRTDTQKVFSNMMIYIRLKNENFERFIYELIVEILVN